MREFRLPQAAIDVTLEENPIQAGEPSLILSVTVPDPETGEAVHALLRLHFGQAVSFSAFLLALLLEATRRHPESAAIRRLLEQPFKQ